MSKTSIDIDYDKIGYVGSIESLGGVDGPGLRTVFFLQGCPARCVYCHNPELIDPSGGKPTTVSEILKIAERNRAYFGKHGGVTFSGGEPLVQSKFLLHCILACKEAEIHTCIDTSGVVFDKAIFDSVDLVLLDIKHTDPKAYNELVGVSIDTCMQVIEYLSSSNISFIARQVICKGINDTVHNILRLKQLASHATSIELLPYHSMARTKYDDLGWQYPDYLEEPDAETMRQLESLIK